jgi:hypothetical protein
MRKASVLAVKRLYDRIPLEDDYIEYITSFTALYVSIIASLILCRLLAIIPVPEVVGLRLQGFCSVPERSKEMLSHAELRTPVYLCTFAPG